MNDGWYYLHINGSLIYKRFRPDLPDFVIKIWSIETQNRANAWTIASEALALGASKKQIFELKEKWGLTDEDGKIFASKVNLKLFKDGNKWCATSHNFINLQESQAGFGDTALEAFAELAKQGHLV